MTNGILSTPKKDGENGKQAVNLTQQTSCHRDDVSKGHITESPSRKVGSSPKNQATLGNISVCVRYAK